MPSRPSPRRLVELFAAHLAHLLNSGSEVVDVQPFQLYRRLIATLTARRDERAGAYGNHLVGWRRLGPDYAPEEAAEAYFERVLRRPLFLARAEPTHKAHEMFLALCRRGLDARWASAELTRSLIAPDRSGGPGAASYGAPADYASVADRLARLDMSVSPGNPAARTREMAGPLFLSVAMTRSDVAEEMSVWAAIICAPSRLTYLTPGSEFNSFCALVIKAVETANAPYAAILSLGLSPLAWSGELSVNTAKKVSAFLAEVRTNANAGHTLDGWRAAWEQRTVPGFASADAFWHSELGRAIRDPQVTRLVDLDVEALEIEGPAPSLLGESEFEDMLQLCLREGAIDDFDAWILQQVYLGRTSEELMRSPRALARLGGEQAAFRDYLEALTDRVHLAARRHAGTAD